MAKETKKKTAIGCGVLLVIIILLAIIIGTCLEGSSDEDDSSTQLKWKYQMGDYVMFTEAVPEYRIFLSQTAYVLSTIESYKDWGRTYQVVLTSGKDMLFKKQWLEEKTMKTQKHYFDEEKARG